MLLFPAAIFAQTGSVEGTVIDQRNDGVINLAKITLENISNDFQTKTQSDLLGKYKFENLAEGNYQITVTRLGYQKEIISGITVDGKKTEINIFLSPVDIEIEKINVTATKTELTLKQTPSSISIVSSDEIQNKNLLTFDEVLSDVQGVTVFKTSGINVQSLSIRGSSDVAGGGIGNRVLLLLDGRPSLTGDSKGALWSLIPISIIDRTEVVKGAFSSLYGSSAIGGVVNVITKKPTYRSFTSLNLNYGFYEKLSDSLRFTDKLLQFKGADISHSNTYKKLAYLFNLSYKQNDGHAEQTDYEFYSGIAKLMYDVLRNRDLEVTLQYTKSNSAFPHYWRKDPGKIAEPFKTSPGYIGDRIKKETQSVDVFYTALPSAITKYTSRFYFYKLNSLSYYNPNNFVAQQYAPQGEPLETTIKSYNFGNISQLDYEISKRNYLITGIDVQWNVVRSNPESILYGNQQLNNFAAFAQNQYKIVKDKAGNTILSSTAGIRIDYNKFVGLGRFTQLSPKLAFLYAPNSGNILLENTSFRALIGRAFRAPSIAELYFKKELFGGFDFIFNPNLKPEEMLSAEIGFRKQYEKRFTLDISAYINEYDNLIQYVNIGGNINGPFQVQNIAKAQIKGIEFLIDYSSSLNLFKEPFGYAFSFNYSLIDARDLSKTRKEDFLPYKPSDIINFSADLNYFGFNFNVNGKYVSKVDEVLFYKFEEPDEYFQLDMKLSKRIFGKVTLFAAVNNLTNSFYQELERTQAPNRSFNSGFRVEF
ncbi:MAG: TonB-dependent receptor [Chlorobi bacterium]|nr:TonB-dependent receptor [Chlorobiota bacterium]MCI0715972.1 TonB-dependent receptor [Chlorobiota bacterium]